MDFTLQDINGEELEVGARVDCGDGWTGRVTDITEPDGDVDDYGRSIAVGPFVTVRFDNGQEDTFTAYAVIGGWGDYMREDLPYRCDDLELIPSEPSSDPMDADDGLSDPDTYARIMWGKGGV